MSSAETKSYNDRVKVSIEGGIADVRLDRADKRNALDPAMFDAIARAGKDLVSNKEIRAVVLSGSGASFCAGLDFASFQSMANGGSSNSDTKSNSGENAGAMQPGAITHLAQQICWVWQEVPVPVIAAIQGHALGGGMQLALGADIRIAHPDTQFAMREVHWGLIPDMTGTLMLSRLVRDDVAKDLVFSARVISGTEAHQLGVVTRLTDSPLETAMQIASEIAERSPDAVRGAKALINRLSNAGAAEHFAEERKIIYSLIGKPNQVEAVTSNFEKRPASFVSPTA
ncbi:MAG: crotonase/enoyl-CoA hydratase family protein [Ilumatobacteraceae bacterium]|nr:crotonase/enoyl-CoA hydratase family protein [Ilumatobacteraceae bacterium]MBJ7422032.1 crotonase/enoyl-CoA hydratase family protein [Ilumatobacteraceae bacterium]